MNAFSEYTTRLQKAQSAEQVLARRANVLSGVRLSFALLAAAILWASWSQALFSIWWTSSPALVFVAFVMWHQSVLRKQAKAKQKAAYYAESLERLADRWIGTGATGEVYRQPDHVFADDLDLFGDGSLFQLVSRARTYAGASRLAEWLLHFAAPDVIIQRQQAVEELAPALDLREDIALLGAQIGPVLKPTSLAEWGAAPPIPVSATLRMAALLLSVLGLFAFMQVLRARWPLSALLAVLLVNLILIFAARATVNGIAASIETPVGELELLSQLIARLEQEHFTGSHLAAVRHQLDVENLPASRRIARLRRWVELVDSSDHILVRVVSPFLLWKQQLAFAVEAWRQAHGPSIGGWLDAVAEMEALSSLAGLRYERPSWTFPIVTATSRVFASQGLRHPLISDDRSVPNDLTLNDEHCLLIVSGSNMSGKSTLLRSVGLNALLAGAGAPVCAGHLTVSLLQIGASLRVSDSLKDNKSRFFAEITRLRDIVNLTHAPVPLLFLLDELLSGTNSHDRRIGAAAIVRNLVNAGAFGLLTTHDLALANIADDLPGRAENVHLEDEMHDGKIEFDYRLKPGVVARSNALELMRAVGLSV